MATREQLRCWGAELTLRPLSRQQQPLLPLPPPPPPPPHIQEVYVPPLHPPIHALEGLIHQCSAPYEKQLTESDVNPSQSRLALQKKYVNEKLKPMLGENERMEAGIGVLVYDAEGKEYEMTFKEWGKMVVLTTGWKEFVQRHNLMKDVDFVTLWMLRPQQQLIRCTLSPNNGLAMSQSAFMIQAIARTDTAHVSVLNAVHEHIMHGFH
ncbi:hypothetical protein Ancab_016850 [Ancistrocladus abbreviatus]